ncbi:hypothetical protein [Bifidobacterium sp.]|jgi:hypothetical protein|uniref:hypothetical protein n=1 Tax=Bifidobacterium sp. TaxID=41200 RepID=UPI0025BE6A58|nr:hypothetical protein [Bifidobacterium sp.]MCI1635190.1 hypothetical protein [Bifidobacterium sp.]
MVSVIVGCQVCGAETSGGRVCGNCTSELAHTLRHLAARLPDLRIVAAKKATVMAREQGHGARTVAPIPLNAGAWQLQQSIEKYAVTLAGVLTLPYRKLPAESLLKGAASRTPALMQRRDAASIHTLATIASRRLDRQLEPPQSRILIGQCPYCGDDVWSSEDDLAVGWQPCNCGQTINIPSVQEQRIFKLAISDAQGTAAALSKLLKNCGITVRRQTISEWKRRGIINSVSTQDGKPVFLLWDVWAAVTR